MMQVIVFLIVLLPVSACADNWRIHMKVCNQDTACAKAQAKARDLWDNMAWTEQLKRSCRKQYIQPYWKDYSGAVNCVVQLESARQEFQLKESEIKRNNNTRRTYKYGHGIRVK